MSLTLFLGKTRKIVDETSWLPKPWGLAQPFSRLVKLVYNGSNILSSEVWFPCSAIFKTMILDTQVFLGRDSSSWVTFSRFLLDRTDFELQSLLSFIQNMRPFLIGSKANWCLPYLGDASNIPSVRWYISFETKLIDSIFDWIPGCIGNRPSINLVSTRD